MIAHGWLFVLVGGVPLLAFAASARPMRGESLMGLHLMVLPTALALTLGLGIAAEWRQTALPAAALYAALLGWLVAIVALSFACFGRTKVRLVQLLTLLAVAAPMAVLEGAHVRPTVQLAGGAYVVALGAGALVVLASSWVGLRWRRRAARPRARTRSNGSSARSNARTGRSAERRPGSRSCWGAGLSHWGIRKRPPPVVVHSRRDPLPLVANGQSPNLGLQLRSLGWRRVAGGLQSSVASACQ